MFSGSTICAGCHQRQFNEWINSDHFKSMAEASSDSVLADFDNVTVSFHKIKSHFFKRDGKFWVTTANDKGQQQTFQILYTFGHSPLQQYLVETGDGHIQALNVAWDSRTKQEGGQRWFHLRPDEAINSQHPFYWTRHFQNWNSRCASCHSTNLSKNYNVDQHTYKTQWSEINVACEACHGPGSKHVALAQAKKYSKSNTGFSHQLPQSPNWQFKQGESIAQPIGEKNRDHINMCGNCHALRTQLMDNSLGEDFHDSSHLQLLNQPSYFSDGQIREEVFVLGSFLQSKMHAKGVNCSNCHNPHSGKVIIEGNGLCNQCHKPQVYDVPGHHHHPENSTGSACVNCHMPNRTYMQVDERRDHSFTIPRPDLSLELGVPNACATCHQDEVKRNPLWASQQLSKWEKLTNYDHWSHLNYRAQQGDVLVTRPLVALVGDDSLSAMIRGSLLEKLANMPSRVSVEAALKSLQDESPLVRRAAVTSLRNLPARTRWELLESHMKDSSRSVRFQIAEVLSDVLMQLPEEQRGDLSRLIKEYRESLIVSADSPATQLTIASLEMRLGNIEKAEQAFQQALRIEPNYVPALINMADYYRSTGRESKSESLLQKALEIAPESGAAHHSYGLLLVRNQDYAGALPYLKAAIHMEDAQPRYAYVYAVALDNRGNTGEAIKVLADANERLVNQYDLLMTLILYLEKTGNTMSIYKYLSALTAIAPNQAEVKKLVKKYSH